MKFQDIKKLSAADQEKTLKEAREALVKLNSQVATGTPPKSPGQIKEYKKTIARVKTLQGQEVKSHG
jgi:large subunit ribosomal protein L29